MTYDMDPNRIDAPSRGMPRYGISRTPRWALPLGLLALAIVAGLFFFNRDERTTTANNDRAPITTNVPTQTPAPMPPNTPPPASSR